ncbi:MAG: hypothetical protein GVY08_09185 [Bacteroidetes bacterium]|nr:hypothetical protein [Bacteroidota bacterium]
MIERSEHLVGYFSGLLKLKKQADLKSKSKNYSLKNNNRKFISIVVATIAALVPISTAAPHQLNFSEPLFLLLWCSSGILCAFGTYLYYNLSVRDMIGTFVIGYMLAVILRFVADIIVNNIARTNLSITLFYAMLVGAVAGWAGSALWILLRKSTIKNKKNRK